MAGGKKQITALNTIPFRGGAMTAQEKALIPAGGYSMIQNMRQGHPGLFQRKGMATKHTTAITGTPKILSLYQFNKAKRTESHFYAQASDDDIYKATDNPPTVTTGVFGSAIFTGSASSMPAAWSNLEEVCLFSNGKDQHQINAGTTNYVKKFIKFDSDAAPPNVPTDGYDYTQEVTDGDAATCAVLDSLDTLANFECIFICTPVPANKLTWTFITGHENDTAATGTLSYRKSDNTWEDTEEIDGTSKGDTDTLGQNGSMTWSQQPDEIPCYMFGVCGFWYQWKTGTQLDDEVEVSSLTYGTDGTAAKTFESIVNVWAGWPPYAIEARFQLDTGEPFETYGTDTIEIDSMTTSGKVYFNSYDPIMGIYVDPGETPNITASTTVDAIYGWTGAAFETMGTITDGTAGLSKAGWITWTRNTNVQPSQFDTSRYYSYWYYLEVDQILSDDVIISIETMPYFDINEAGKIGYVNVAWKGRAVYNFGDQYGFVSAKNNPLVLNGDDFGIIEAGDGRSNRWTCARQFHNELLVWQEEKGMEGGCLTLFEGNQPKNFGKLLLSSRLGCMNSKSAVVVDGVLVATKTDEVVKTMAFWLSRYGVPATDGRTCTIISDDIGNYFDPKKPECIRKGYEKENFLFHDSADNVLRLGLVSGVSVLTSTATSTTANKLNDTAGAFTTLKEVSGHPITHKIAVGDTVYNTTDGTTALITAVSSATQLTLDTDIMVSGEGYEIYAAVPNLFPVFDLVDKTWGFDVLGQNLSCMTEVEAQSGNISVLQYAGATDDGGVYRLNTGTNDVDIATVTNPIDSYGTMELDYGGNFLALRKMLLRVKSQAAGNVIVTPSRNTREGTAINLPMTAETTSDAFRRHKIGMDVQDPHISLKFQNATASQELHLLDVGYELYTKETH